MNKKMNDIYKCPYNKTNLLLEVGQSNEDEIFEGSFINKEGRRYAIVDGIPIFFTTDVLSGNEIAAKTEYDKISEFYDNAIAWLFASFYEDEPTVRNQMVDFLEIDRVSKVLEVGCGTARDSLFIAARLGKQGSLYLQDISEKMVQLARQKMTTSECVCETHYFVSAATYLPFEDDYFDALYTFGGFNEFSDPVEALKEFARVVKTGGKVVFGDENIAPWLEDTEYAEIVKTNNPIFKRTSLPLKFLPANSVETALRWIIGSCFYLIDFRVGANPPALNLDLPHKGWRGGSLRTRYFGQLEGVNPETKRRIIEAAKSSGSSVYEWLENKLNEVLTKG